MRNVFFFLMLNAIVFKILIFFFVFFFFLLTILSGTIASCKVLRATLASHQNQGFVKVDLPLATLIS